MIKVMMIMVMMHDIKQLPLRTRLKPASAAAAAAEAASSGVSSGLEVPTPFAAADVIVHDEDNRLSFHYAIIEATSRPAPLDGQRAPCRVQCDSFSPASSSCMQAGIRRQSLKVHGSPCKHISEVNRTAAIPSAD